MKKYLLILSIIVFVVVFERLLSWTSILNQFEHITYDLRAKIATDLGPFNSKFKHADKKIVLVAVDDFSKIELSKNASVDPGSWPWSRDVWANVLGFIQKGKPKAVLFDLIFNGLNKDLDNDRMFANELAKYNNVVLATSLSNPKILVNDSKKIINTHFLPTNKPLNVSIDNKYTEDMITFYSHAPVNNIYTAKNTMGVVNKVVDRDSVIRKAQPIFKLEKNGKTYYMPSLAFAGFLKFMGEEEKIVIKNNEIHYKNSVIPIDKDGNVILSWHGLGHDYDYVHVSKIILSQNGKNLINPEFFKDKIVIIGRTEAGTDIHLSSVNPSYAGVEANATAIDNFINDSKENSSRKFLTPMNTFSTILLIFLTCGLIAFIGITSKNALICFFNSVGFILLYLLFCVWMFTSPAIRIIVPVVVPMYYLIMTFAIVFAFRFQKEIAKKAMIMNMFGKFVSPKVLQTLMKNQDNLVLKSTRKKITVMFCDVKNFTTLSEQSNPDDLVNDLNELFNVMVDVIFENNGTVDKFIGDCIMAYWGDPIASEDDAYMAVKTAIEIKQKVREHSLKNEKEGKIIFDVKMGINTGEALMGLSGSQKIMSYTAMGDAVNVASRLESNCARLQKDILISKTTYDDAKYKINFVKVDTISVKGRNEQIEIFEPIISDNSDLIRAND